MVRRISHADGQPLSYTSNKSFFQYSLGMSTQVLDRSASDVREICPERLTAVTIMCCIPLGVAEESL
jgi:hypothetical protein